jgi:3-dehydroquinate dehydratase/shikimate dehydrogenase
MMDKAESVLRENSLIELRLDYLKAPLGAMARLRRLTEARPDGILIATCRRKAAGGNFDGSLDDQLEVLRKATDAGCAAVDIDIESAEAMSRADWEEMRSRAAIVLSSHDFESTSRLEETFARMRSFNSDFYKVVGTATCLHDNVVMTRFLEEHCQEYSMVGMCMGEQGTLSRILGIRAGGAFTFGSEGAGKETAPGQPTYRELRDFFRIEMVETVTKVYGIAGNPISHSMSPWVMNTAFRRENVNAVYLPLHAKTLSDLLATVTGLPLDGVSVTMPYKQAVVAHLDNSDVPTQQCGACNTVVRGKDGRLFGFNTDLYGIVAAIEPRMTLQGARVLVIGAGGAARAAVIGLKAKGADVAIVNRTPATAAELAKQLGIKTVKRNEVAKLSFDLIFNATPVGMGSDGETPLNENELNTTWVFDSVYNPVDTPLLKLAQSKGLGTISGAEMFLHQAARQFEIWTGKPAPMEAIRQVLLRQLGAAGGEGTEAIPTVVSPKIKPVAASTTASADAGEAPKAAEAAEPAKSKAAAKEAPAKSGGQKTAAKAAAPAAKVVAKTTTQAPVNTAVKKAAAKPAAKKSSKAKGR